MKNISEVIEQVQKLIRLSESKNANEALAATTAANKLIDKYRLSKADLEVESESAESLEEDYGYLYETGRVTPWKHMLMHILTKHYGVAIWNDANWNSGRQFSRFKMVGRKSDMSIVSYMFSWLALECERLTLLEARGTGMGRIFVASYQEGFVNGISSQLSSSREDLRKESTSTAMVKIESRQAESEAFMYSLHSNLKKKVLNSSRHVDKGAFDLGKSRGEKIHLGTAISNDSNIKILK